MVTARSTAGTVARATALIVVFTALSKVLGFLRETVLAYGFGAGSATDAYLVAWTVPGIIFSILGGALVAGAVPLFTSYRSRWGEDEAWRLFSSMITLLLVSLSVFAVLGECFARQLVWLITPGLPTNTAALATDLTRIVLPTVVILALGNVYYGLLNANGIFWAPGVGLGSDQRVGDRGVGGWY